MRPARFLIIPFVMIFVLACGLANGIQGIATQLPGVLTSMPTALGAIETVGAQGASSNCPSTPAAGGLGISLATGKAVLQFTNQFTFTDGTVNGQAASTVTLSADAAAAYPAIANGFSAQYIGDPCNLSEIKITVPRTDQQETVDQGIGLVNIVLAGFMPPQVQLSLVTWLTQEYASIQVGGHQQTTIDNLLFTMTRSQTEIILDILPAS